MAQIVLDRLAARFTGGEILESGSAHGDEWARVRRDAWIPVAMFLREDPAIKMEMFIDLTCVDRFGMRASPGGIGPQGLTARGPSSNPSAPMEVVTGEPPRFDVVLHVYSVSLKHRVRLYCGAPEEDPWVDTLVSVWPGTNWFEREAYDLYGVRFKGHPDLRRILMYPEFVGHPLRKDYPKEKRQPLVRRQAGQD
jgi:NADH-quinone oxidoreductase subunit C